MDLLKQLALRLTELTGIPAEADPSTANIPDSHFIVTARSFWVEPDGTTRKEGYTMKTDDGLQIVGYLTALPIRVVWTWAGNGEAFRSAVINQTNENAKTFAPQFGFYGQMMKVPPGPAYDAMANVIPDFDDVNKDGIHGLWFVVELIRDPGSDVVFELQDNDMYLVEQHFIGNITTESGQGKE